MSTSSQPSFYRRRRRARSASGFTLIELITVLTIVILITGVILFNTSGFNSAILLRSLAYEVGLSVREAQLYGVAVRQSQSGDFNASYGVYFNSATIGASNPNSTYPLFADTYPPGAPDGQYTAGEDTLIETFKLNNGFYIEDFCATTDAGGVQCASTGAIHWMTIVFTRPNPEANILTDANPTLPSAYQSATITVESPSGATHTVTVSLTGQISVQ
jgi:type II secretory pathway pseudopilin PulG